jgi:hypothetical protein
MLTALSQVNLGIETIHLFWFSHGYEIRVTKKPYRRRMNEGENK